MLSKPQYTNEFINVKNKEEKKPKTKVQSLKLELSFSNYFKNNIVLKKYKIVQLKEIAKYNKLHISGSKPVLIERIQLFFEKSVTCSKIQKIFRGHIVRQSFLLRGEGYTHRKLCVNENDFYTLEPLNEISSDHFFSFKSNDDKFIYGCNIISLLHLIQNKSAVKNPYNRETIKNEVIQRILKLYLLIKIIFGIPEDAPKMIPTIRIIPVQHNIRRLNDELTNDRQIKINTMRAKTIPIRIQELFMEIDQLGNYTNYHWFLDLERRDYIKLYRTIYDIWTFRGHLSREMKYNICILEDPFHEIHRERIYLYEASLDVVRELCLKVFEKLVYCGIDDEHKKIGTLHVLSALTIVSENARNAMPWLYESLYP